MKNFTQKCQFLELSCRLIQNIKKLMDRQFLTFFCGLPIKIYDFVSLLFKNIPTLSKNTVHVACLCAIKNLVQYIGLRLVLCVESEGVCCAPLPIWMPPRSQYSVFCLVYGPFSLLCMAKDSKRASLLIRSVVAFHRLLER